MVSTVMRADVRQPRIGFDLPVLDADSEFALLQQAHCPRLYARRARNLALYRDRVHSGMSDEQLSERYHMCTKLVNERVDSVAQLLLKYRENADKHVDMENQIRWHLR